MDQETVLFFGRFHPLILHLPIGFLIIGFVLEVLCRLERFRHYRAALGFVLMLGAGSAWIAAALGYMLAQAGGYSEDLLFIHQWGGITMAVAATCACILYRLWQQRKSAILQKAYTATMVLMIVSLSVTGHFGGSLTHGSDYLTQYMPNGLRMIAGLPKKETKDIPAITNVDEAVIFDQIIYPIFDAKCISCHNESKRKGELMLHTPEAIMKGGENGAVFIAGSAEESALIKRIHLPEADDDHMPPKGKQQLTDDEVTLLTWWIDQQAPFDKTVAQVNVNDEIRSVLRTLADPNANKSEVDLLLEKGVGPVETTTLAQLQSRAVKLRPISKDKNWLQAKVAEGFSGDSLVSSLTPLAEQLTWLDLGNTATTDDVFLSLSQFKNLTQLHLENTLVTDEGLQQLKTLPYLEYLNIHGTSVTDEGLMHLSDLSNLRKVYVWKTNVTEEGARKLKERLSDVEINLGIEGPSSPAEGGGVRNEIIESAPAKNNTTLTSND